MNGVIYNYDISNLKRKIKLKNIYNNKIINLIILIKL